MLAFGPVPSRRLGKSLGINNIPPKICTYSCVYCQVGRGKSVRARGETFYEPSRIISDTLELLQRSRQAGDDPDYLTFVPDGEPTLDMNLGQEIKELKTRCPVAVITNSSLLPLTFVQDALMQADWVSLKIDTVNTRTWHKINRPHASLHLDSILESILEFAHSYRGTLVTETMLVQDINDTALELEPLAEFIKRVEPSVAYLSVPTRPPAETRVQCPDEKQLIRAFNILSNKVKQVEYLIGYEGNAFASTGNVEQDIASITAVHPMRQDAVMQVLKKRGADWSVIDHMLEQHILAVKHFQGETFYTRVLKRQT